MYIRDKVIKYYVIFGQNYTLDAWPYPVLPWNEDVMRDQLYRRTPDDRSGRIDALSKTAVLSCRRMKSRIPASNDGSMQIRESASFYALDHKDRIAYFCHHCTVVDSADALESGWFSLHAARTRGFSRACLKLRLPAPGDDYRAP
jgi:hypothetical protein